MRTISLSKRVALLGAGHAAGPHLGALRAMGCDVTSVVTRDSDRFSAVLSYFPGAKQCVYGSEALQMGVDAALVLSPAHRHLADIRLTAQAKIPSVVEKPLSLSVPEAREILRVTSDANVPIVACYQHRAGLAGTTLREAVLDGLLGELRSASVLVPWWRDGQYYAEQGRGTFTRDGGGVLITQAVHALDLLLWITGYPNRVAALATKSLIHGVEVEDSVGILLQFDNDLFATVNASVSAFPGSDYKLVLIGTKATATINSHTLVISSPFGEEIRVEDSGPEHQGSGSVPNYGRHFRLLTDAFESFDSGSKAIGDVASAMVTQRVVAASYLAVRTQEWVDLDDPIIDSDAAACLPW